MKKDLTNPLVIISFFLILATMILFIYYYFIKPIQNDKVREDVDAVEKQELELLTRAYLDQNYDLNVGQLFFNFKVNEYQVASEYYYLKNGKEVLDKYDEILEVARDIFDDKGVNLANFTINLDECGREKYSTLEGFTYKDECDKNGLIYQIDSIYKNNNTYVVEFFASIASQSEITTTNKCSPGKLYSYNLKLKNLENYQFHNYNYFRCSEDDFKFGLSYLKNEIISMSKESNYKYKLSFKKSNQNFTFYSLKK